MKFISDILAFVFVMGIVTSPLWIAYLPLGAGMLNE